MQASSPLRSVHKVALAVGVVLVASAGVYAGYTLLLHRDFRVVCEAYEKTPSAPAESAAAAFEIANYIDSHAFTRPVRQAVNAVAFASNEDRYSLMQTAAAQSGIEDWECPAMKAYLQKSTVPGETSAVVEPVPVQAPAGVVDPALPPTVTQ